MYRKLFSIGLSCLMTLFVITPIAHAQAKITGPWLWMIAPTEAGRGGAHSTDIDSLAVASGGAVTEADVAANGANEGDRVGNFVWTLGQISATGSDNINDCINRIGLAAGNVDDHSSYALFTLESATTQRGVTMRVGSDDSIKVWLNGEVVHRHAVNRGSGGFQDEFQVDLVAGDNLLMVKVSELGGDWSMFAGIDSGGTAGGDRGTGPTDLNASEPPMVRLIYISPNDRAPEPDIDAKIVRVVKDAQQFFANEMERHGFGRKTFMLETDATGKTVVHRNDRHFTQPAIRFTVDSNAALGCGMAGPSGFRSGNARISYADVRCLNWGVAAHELGHAFGLAHDFRNDIYLMSYGHVKGINHEELSKCAAEWLDVHRAFNTVQHPLNEDTPPRIEMLPPTIGSAPNTIRLRFKISDADGLHQVQLYPSGFVLGAIIGFQLQDCKRLNGSPNSTVEFVTTDVTPRMNEVRIRVIDVHGNWNGGMLLHGKIGDFFTTDVLPLLPPPEVVSIPDNSLASAVRRALMLYNQPFTSHAMLDLKRLNVPNDWITDLTGLEHATNLTELNLGGQYVSGEGYVNSNAITNFSPLSRLTHLKTLNLGGISISDVSPLVSALWELKNLRHLYLFNTSISDVSALARLTQLIVLNLSNTSISDVSALARLTQLIVLNLSNTSISDVPVLTGLTQLRSLHLSNTSISDVSALAGLTQLTTLILSYNDISDVSPLLGLNLTGLWGAGLYLKGNPLSYASINTHIPTLQNRGVTVEFDNRTPTTLVKISGTEQQAAVNAPLPRPLVVEVRDEHNRAFSGVPVTFAVTAGGGKLSVTTATTDLTGRAQARLTLGQTVGTATVSVAAAEISQPVRFTATAPLLSSPVTVPDTALRAKIAETLGKSPGGSLTMADMLTLTALTANNANIRELTGLHYAANLTTLSLDNNNLSDVSSLAGLPKLKILSLDNSNLSDLTPLAGLTQLTTLSLDNNNLSDISTLVGLTQLKTLHLRENLLSYPSLYTHIPTLQAAGTVVVVDPRTPTTLLNISSTHGVAGAALPFVVEVQDENGLGFSGVPVTFTITTGGGKPRATTATTDITGRARTTLTLGGTPGKNTVRASAAAISQPINFTITAIDTSSPVTVPDAALRARIVETLGKPVGVQLTAGEMLALTKLDAPNANIQDLTGLEYAHTLRTLNLGGEWISGRYVNSNAVSNFSPFLGLTQLTWLNLSNTSISDVSALSGLTQLTWLNLSNTSISDVSALAGLPQLTYLYLSNTSISDVSALAGLTQLTWLYLSNNAISDVSALSGLTQLTLLYLSNTSISDVSALAGLTQLTWLYLSNNAISDVSALAGLTQLTSLYLSNTSISDVSALAGLTQLTSLYLSNTSISDVSALSGLTQLTSLYLWNNAISDVSPLLGLNLTGTQWDSTGLYLQGNPLSYASIHTHIPTLQAKGIEVKFDNRTPTKLVKISGAEQQATVNAALPHPFVVEVRDERNRVFSGVPVTFVVTAGGGTLSVTNTTTDESGRAESTLTLGSNPGTNIVEVSAAGIKPPVTFNTVPAAYLLSVPAGISLIHVPLKVTAVDGVAKPITSISDLYDALGGADTVNLLGTHDPKTQRWFSYADASDKGTSDDPPLTDDKGIIASMKTPVAVRLRGDALGTNGHSSITLFPGLNLVGVPLKDSRIARVSDLFALAGIGSNVSAITVSANGRLKTVRQAGDEGDIPITGGQSFILRVQEATTVAISGSGWYNTSAMAASSPVAMMGIEVGDTTPILAVRGSIVDEGTSINKADFRVIVKNLSTGRAVSTVIGNEDSLQSKVGLNLPINWDSRNGTDLSGGIGYRLTVVDMETGRAAMIGDSVEISVRSPSPLIRVEPLRYTVTAEDVKRSRIELPALVAYEIPSETELLANYPNPFNPETWIPYRLAEDAFVTLTIYDGSGRVVRTLDVGHRIAAVYENRSKAAYWDGRNEVGERVASGLYFYHLLAEDYSATRRMVVVK